MQIKRNFGAAVFGCAALVATSLPLSAVAAELGSSDGKALTVPDAPTGKAPIGSMVSRSITCAALQAAGAQRFGSVDSTWEYRYSSDTDEDGEPDAKPAWALSSVSVYFYPPQEAIACK